MTTIYGNQLPLSQKRDIKSEKPKIFGLNFPIGVNSVEKKYRRGYFSKESGIYLVRGNLKQLLGTIPGERVMLPRYGLDLRRFLFEPLDSDLFGEIREAIRDAVTIQLPMVQITKLTVISLDSAGYTQIPGIKITLSFTLKDDTTQVGDVTVKVGI